MPKAKGHAKPKPTHNSPLSTSSRRAPPKVKDPKTSHLYTDDNPSTTIHGTGFKDSAAAERTLNLIQNRSLLYQWQTVNTMYNRAKHHPSMKKGIPGAASTADMRSAMEIFGTWLETTYPAQKAALRAGGFKPLLSKKVMERYLPLVLASGSVHLEAKAFAEMYVSLAPGKKMGNVLVDPLKPTEADWERKRYDALCALVPEEKITQGAATSWSARELWTGEEGGVVSERHLACIAWGWSPVGEGKLP
ncbi:hypothetical protein LTR62_004708 [Meristemomyces frigidus]|uniref:Uncharacterized protein n=1 Tax=Meristemomyces frigidus TaxID=1508187 RepID=A0AAN7TGC2_9PEZI|nr:hypothetical protein LTR62_004708 [Meristemomyces frigidus]